VRASNGQYDLLIMNSGWFAGMYFGGFVEAITDIDPSFKLDPDVYTLGDTVYFDPAKKVMTPAGKLMSVPIAPLIPLLYYRGDLYQEAGLKAPETFAELVTNARAVHSTSPVNYIWVHSESDASTWVRFVDNDTVYLDPCTAAVLGEQYRYGGLFGRLEQLHRFKFMPHGSLVTGSSALSFVALTVIGGFIVWWPHTLRALKAALSFRSRLTGRAYRMHLHRALGG